MQTLPFKSSIFTLVLMLFSVSMVNVSCGVKLPTDVQSTIGTISKALPLLMNKATTSSFSPEIAKEADGLLSMITNAANLTKGGKTDKVSGLISGLGANKVKPFIDMWKSKGKLDANTVSTAVKGVNSALSSIKKAGKIK